MEAEHVSMTLTKPLISHLELTLMPQPILIIGRQRILGRCEFGWKRSKIDKVGLTVHFCEHLVLFTCHVEGVVSVKVVEFTLDFFVDGLVDFDVLLGVVFLVVVVDVVHDVVVHVYQLFVEACFLEAFHLIEAGELAILALLVKGLLLFRSSEYLFNQVPPWYQFLDNSVARILSHSHRRRWNLTFFDYRYLGQLLRILICVKNFHKIIIGHIVVVLHVV